MSKNELAAALAEAHAALLQHKSEWAGMLGTSFERQDYAEKKSRFDYLVSLMAEGETAHA